MRNVETRNFETDVDAMTALLNSARNDERKNRAEIMYLRLNALAEKISSGELVSVEACELVRQEAEEIKRQAWELN